MAKTSSMLASIFCTSKRDDFSVFMGVLLNDSARYIKVLLN
jgi:hypothetical protein